MDFKPGDMFLVKDCIELDGDYELYNRNPNSKEPECFILTEFYEDFLNNEEEDESRWYFDIYRSEVDARADANCLNDHPEFDDRIANERAWIAISQLTEELAGGSIRQLNRETRCLYCGSPTEHSGKYEVCTECYRVQDDS